MKIRTMIINYKTMPWFMRSNIDDIMLKILNHVQWDKKKIDEQDRMMMMMTNSSHDNDL